MAVREKVLHLLGTDLRELQQEVEDFTVVAKPCRFASHAGRRFAWP